jgi:hypothetical protein
MGIRRDQWKRMMKSARCRRMKAPSGSGRFLRPDAGPGTVFSLFAQAVPPSFAKARPNPYIQHRLPRPHIKEPCPPNSFPLRHRLPRRRPPHLHRLLLRLFLLGSLQRLRYTADHYSSSSHFLTTAPHSVTAMAPAVDQAYQAIVFICFILVLVPLRWHLHGMFFFPRSQ